MDIFSCQAVLFDLDGVLTPTADIHMRAWSQMFNQFLTSRGGQTPYTDEDYYAYLDGKPRYDGVSAFLASRGIELPWGDAGDEPDTPTVCGLGNRKNLAFNEVLARDGIACYPGSAALLDALDEAGIPSAVVSSSRNATAVLAAAQISERFVTVVDGNVAKELGLPGKPQPDTFTYAAKKLGVTPDRAAVLEDAISGVSAGRAGGFGLVIGVNRGVGEQALVSAGADTVVNDCGELIS